MTGDAGGLGDRIADDAWRRCRELLRTWPGAKRLSNDELDAYVRAFREPYGRSSPRCDPLELESMIDELIAADMKGERPAVGKLLDELRIRRQSLIARVDVGTVRDAWGSGGVAPPAFTLAHANARGLPIASLMRAVSIRHGLDPFPPHEPTDCPHCHIEDAERRFAAEHRGDSRTFEHADALAEFERELDERYAWRKGPEH